MIETFRQGEVMHDRYYINVFDVIRSVDAFGVWYCIWAYGINIDSLWTIFIATKMVKFRNKYFGETV